MAGNTPGAVDAVVMVCVFTLVACLWGMAGLLWWARRSSRIERIQRRLDYVARPVSGEGRVLRLWQDGREATTIVPKLKDRAKLGARLAEMREQAGMRPSVRNLTAGIGGAALLAGIVAAAMAGNPLLFPCAAAAVLLLAWIYLKQRIATRMLLFETQLVDALELAARSLRAGHPLHGAFRLIAEEIKPPVGTVFAEICQQQGLGVSLDTALHKTAEAAPSADLKLFATSVLIQARSGGNLADMMERLAYVIRDRMRLSRRVRVLTTQTQFSKRVLLALPVAVFVLLNLLNPRYMMPLYQTKEGQLLLVAAACGLLVGAWAMNRLAVIRY